jgi:hypothetical protein
MNKCVISCEENKIAQCKLGDWFLYCGEKLTEVSPVLNNSIKDYSNDTSLNHKLHIHRISLTVLHF